MSAASHSAPSIHRYQAPQGRRRFAGAMLGAAAAGVVGLLWLAALPGPVRPVTSPRAILTFDLGAGAPSSAPDLPTTAAARSGSRAPEAAAPATPSAAATAAGTRAPAASTRAQQSLVDAAAQALGDDPLFGFAELQYQHLLERHILRFLRPPSGRGAAGLKGTVRLRARLSRDGRLVDVLVVRSAGAMLDEAAMQAIWRADPLPAVPASLRAPYVVDVPVGFDGLPGAWRVS